MYDIQSTKYNLFFLKNIIAAQWNSIIMKSREAAQK